MSSLQCSINSLNASHFARSRASLDIVWLLNVENKARTVASRVMQAAIQPSTGAARFQNVFKREAFTAGNVGVGGREVDA